MRIQLSLLIIFLMLNVPALRAQSDLSPFVGPVLSELETRFAPDAVFALDLAMAGFRSDLGANEEHAQKIREIATERGISAVSFDEVLSCPENLKRQILSECWLSSDGTIVVRFGRPEIRNRQATISVDVIAGGRDDLYQMTMRADFVRNEATGIWQLNELVGVRET